MEELEQLAVDKTSRASFLRTGLIAGAGLTAVAAGLPANSLAALTGRTAALTAGDVAILGAASIAEALAVTTYSNIIDTAPFFKHLESDDQGYLRAARQEEMSHYLLEVGATKKPSPFTTFYYPKNMFTDAQTTLNVLVTLEDAFIAAYLVGVRQLQHRRPACDRGADHGHRERPPHAGAGGRARASPKSDGGPIETVTGVPGQAESVDPPNNNGYERTLEVDEHQPGRQRATPVRRPSTRRAKPASTPQAIPASSRSHQRSPRHSDEFHSFAG